MLGGLARWLRMLGYDTEYDSKTSDNDLLKTARSEDRILLTRDEELYTRAQARALPSLLIKGEHESERLGFLAKELQLSLDINMAATRCPECGVELGKVSKTEIASLVPPASLKLYDEYWKCKNPSCGKVYWVGSHWTQIHATLEKARKLALDGRIQDC